MIEKGCSLAELKIGATECTVIQNTYDHTRIGARYVQIQHTWFRDENGYEFSLSTSSPDFNNSNAIPIISGQKVIIFNISEDDIYHFCFYNFSTNNFHKLIFPGYLVVEGKFPKTFKRYMPFYIKWSNIIYIIFILIFSKFAIVNMDISIIKYFSVQFILLICIAFAKSYYARIIKKRINSSVYNIVHDILKKSYGINVQ